MRRRVLLVTFALPFTIAIAAHGCSSGPPLEDFCAFLRDPASCFSAFHKDLGEKCGFVDPADAKGSFGSRAMLDICILTAQGGQVVFDPPLDVTKFPPTEPVKVKFIEANGAECGSVEITEQALFTLTINPPPGADAGADAAANPGAPLEGGTLAVTGIAGMNTLDLSCPARSPTGAPETHHFNSLQLSQCPAFADIAPRAILEGDIGGVNRDGQMRLTIHYPPASGAGLGGTDPRAMEGAVVADLVTYFDCVIPEAPPLFQDGIKNGGESDIDCGGTPDATNHPARCEKGQACICNDDCAMPTFCSVDAMSGAKKCADSGIGKACL
jgi:hypothetical protein